MVTDLQQRVPRRLRQNVRNKLLPTRCRKNLLRVDNIRHVGGACCESVGLANLVTK